MAESQLKQGVLWHFNLLYSNLWLSITLVALKITRFTIPV